jgi:glycosyltransferase involved in cell wall biosynthesis
LDSFKSTTACLDTLEVILVVDADDNQTLEFGYAGFPLKRIVVQPGLSMGALNMAGYEAATGDYLMLLNDDVIVRTQGWDEKILATFKTFADGIVLVHVNDKIFEEKLCTFPFLSRSYCQLADGICPSDYLRYRIDDHIYSVFNLLAVLGKIRILYLPEVVFEHTNFVLNSNNGAEYRPDERIHAIDTKRFKVDPNRSQRGNLTVGSTSMLRPEKGVDTLIEAFAKLRTPGVRLLLIGDGPEQAALEARVEALGIGDRVQFAGATVYTAPYLHQIDIFVLPSHSEALSNSLMEAMACGCAVVASRVGGNPELVSHGHTGLLFKVGDAADLAAQLECLVKDAPLRRLVAGSGARRIHTEFSIDASIRRFQELYLSLLAAG